MDNDNKVKKTPRRSSKASSGERSQQKAKESIVAAAEEVIINKVKSDEKAVAIYRNQDDVHHQVSVLLETELTRISNDEMKQSFDVETEYAKARKNNIRFAWVNMWSRLFLCVLVVLAITTILLFIVNHNNKRIPVNVKGFDNVKLTELLDDVDKIESKINEEERKKAEYEEKRSEEIQRVEDAYSAEKKRIENIFNQDKKKAERNYSSEKKKVETRQTTGWLEGRSKEKDLVKTDKKYEDSLAGAKKRREDSLAISKAKYREDLARAKGLYRVEIEACKNNISKFKEDRYRFDNDKVQLEAEYDGKLKDKDILHKREMDLQKEDFEAKYLAQKTEYEEKLAAAAKLLEETKAKDFDDANRRVADAINTYDPTIDKDSRLKKSLKTAGNGITYNVGSEDRISYLTKDGASEMFKKSLDSQKSYYEDIAYIYSVCAKFPHKEHRAVATFAKAMSSIANKAGNELYASSVNEVNRIIEEKNKVEFDKKTAINQKDKVQGEFNALLEALCQEKVSENRVSGVVSSGSGKNCKIYICMNMVSMFSNPAYKRHVFPCSLYREGRKIAIARIEKSGDGNFALANIAFSGVSSVNIGDRIVLGEPYLP